MRKALLAIAVIALTVLVVRAWPNHSPARVPSPTPQSALASSAPPAPDTPALSELAKHPTPSSVPYGSTMEATSAWEPVVQGFALAFPDTRGMTRKSWLANLKPYLTNRVLKAFAITDLDKVPQGHYAGYEILKQADETITVRATYQEGWALDLYLTQGRTNVWRIDTLDFDRTGE